LLHRQQLGGDGGLGHGDAAKDGDFKDAGGGAADAANLRFAWGYNERELAHRD
jgi:hypothetical protein